MPGKHVAVLMGGWSAEREVSLRSGKACADALEKQGYRVTKIDVGRDIAQRLFLSAHGWRPTCPACWHGLDVAVGRSSVVSSTG